jgi:hypothetical protein
VINKPHRLGVSSGERMLISFMGHAFHCPKWLARQLWQCMWPSEQQAITWNLDRAATSPFVESVLHLQRAMPPKLLIEILLRVAPEDGRERPKEVLQLEERILAMAADPETWR